MPSGTLGASEITRAVAALNSSSERAPSMCSFANLVRFSVRSSGEDKPRYEAVGAFAFPLLLPLLPISTVSGASTCSFWAAEESEGMAKAAGIGKIRIASGHFAH